MNTVLTLKKNTLGRDIIVTDVHGFFKLLKNALIVINFDPLKDRLIIAGDLVDRGPNSKVAIDWVTKDYCYSVIGNHDAQYMFQDRTNLFKSSLICLPVDPWYTDISSQDFNSFCDTLKKHLFPAIQIETDKGLVGVIHAEVPKGYSWKRLTQELNDKNYDLLHDCIWSREIANLAQSFERKNQNENDYHIDDLLHVFHGHSPSKKLGYQPYSLANRYFIDTGAYKSKKYSSAGITLFDINDPINPIYQSGVIHE